MTMMTTRARGGALALAALLLFVGCDAWASPKALSARSFTGLKAASARAVTRARRKLEEELPVLDGSCPSGQYSQTTCNPAGDMLIFTSFSDDKCTAATGETPWQMPASMKLSGMCEMSGVTSSYSIACADGVIVSQSWATSSSCEGTPSTVTPMVSCDCEGEDDEDDDKCADDASSTKVLSCTGNANGSIASITEQSFTDNACATAGETNTITMAEMDAYFVGEGIPGGNPYTGCTPVMEEWLTGGYSMNCTDGKVFMQYFEDAFCSPGRQISGMAREVPLDCDCDDDDDDGDDSPECVSECDQEPNSCAELATLFSTGGCAASCTSAEDLDAISKLIGPELAACDGFPTASAPTSSATEATPATGSPTVKAVKADVTFPELSMDDFDDETFSTTFRTAYKAQVATAASVDASAVIIDSITPGSVKVASTVYYAPDIETASVDNFVTLLQTTTTSVFTDASFESYGTATAEAQSMEVPLADAMAAGAIAAPTATPTTVPVDDAIPDAAITAAPAGALALVALVAALLF